MWNPFEVMGWTGFILGICVFFLVKFAVKNPEKAADAFFLGKKFLGK